MSTADLLPYAAPAVVVLALAIGLRIRATRLTQARPAVRLSTAESVARYRAEQRRAARVR